MIRGLLIEGYKSLGRVELRDVGRLILVFGPNAAGKSNLLDALDLLGHLVREDSVVAAFAKHRGNRAGREVPIRWFFREAGDAAAEPRRMAFTVDIGLHPPIRAALNAELAEREKGQKLRRPYTKVTRSLLRYRLELTYRPAERALEVTDESLVALGRGGGELIAERPFVRHDAGAERLAVKLERQAHPRYFALPRRRTVLSEVGTWPGTPRMVTACTCRWCRPGMTTPRPRPGSRSPCRWALSCSMVPRGSVAGRLTSRTRSSSGPWRLPAR
jgi:hypothetical protein